MFKVKELKDKDIAVKVGKFLTGPDAFQQTWAPNEKALVEQAPLDSIANENHCYWYIEDKGEVIGAMGVRENKYGSGGYEMDSDYLAVHKNYRRQGLASLLLEEVESFVRDKGGRYIHVLTCDIEPYKPARRFYQDRGYKIVAEIPNYYVENEGRVDFFKEIG